VIPYTFHPDADAELEEAALFYESRMAGLGRSFAAEVERTILCTAKIPTPSSSSRSPTSAGVPATGDGAASTPKARCRRRPATALKVALAFLACALIPATVAGEEGTAAHKEISHLLSRLGASGCQFNRNDSWYPPERAVEHLNTKYEYLARRNLVPTAEAFIERAASESSVSGKPYLVKCGDAPAVPSADWLRETLARYRGGAR